MHGYIPFCPGGNPLNLVLRQWNLFHIPICLVLSIPFNCCKCIVFKTGIQITKHELFHSHIKMHLSLLDLFRLFKERDDWFSYPFIYFNKWNPCLSLSYTWSLHEKDQDTSPRLFRRSLLVWAIMRSTLPPDKNSLNLSATSSFHF